MIELEVLQATLESCYHRLGAVIHAQPQSNHAHMGRYLPGGSLAFLNRQFQTVEGCFEAFTLRRGAHQAHFGLW